VISPWNEPENRLEYTSFINIRPLDDNMAMDIQRGDRMEAVKNLVEDLIFSPDEMMEPLD